MAKITPITFPGKIGTANEIKIMVNFNLEEVTARAIYQLIDSDSRKVLSNNLLVIPEDIYELWGADNQYIINWVAEQIGIELIQK